MASMVAALLRAAQEMDSGTDPVDNELADLRRTRLEYAASEAERQNQSLNDVIEELKSAVKRQQNRIDARDQWIAKVMETVQPKAPGGFLPQTPIELEQRMEEFARAGERELTGDLRGLSSWLRKEQNLDGHSMDDLTGCAPTEAEKEYPVKANVGPGLSSAPQVPDGFTGNGCSFTREGKPDFSFSIAGKRRSPPPGGGL